MAELSFKVSNDFQKDIEETFTKVAREVISEVAKQEINTKQYLNLREASEYIGVSFNTLKLWTNNHGLKTIVIGGKIFISKDTLNEFMKSFEK